MAEYIKIDGEWVEVYQVYKKINNENNLIKEGVYQNGVNLPLDDVDFDRFFQY